MNIPTDLKSRLSAYLQGNVGLDEFRIWFATILRTANQYGEAVQKLVWSVDRELASFGSERTSKSELRENLNRIVESIASQEPLVALPANGGSTASGGKDVLLSGTSSFFQRTDYDLSSGFSGKLEYLYAVFQPTESQFFPWSVSGNDIRTIVVPTPNPQPQKPSLLQLSHSSAA